ncbi:uncharacterized protein LOC143906728 [Temnothorax americanus]|uniref:uncharacterized protein LOC143906728 n=1 Tax=Temnothorax americanus TaxID=1964332 RepID=UPI0040691E29
MEKQVICRHCRKEIKTQLVKCIPCDKVFHPSCHKLHKVYDSANELVSCHGKYEIFTIKNTHSEEASSVKERRPSNTEDNQAGSSMETKIDWLVRKVRDEMIHKNEIKSIITSIVREELEGYRKELEEMKKMWSVMSSGNASRSYCEAVKEKKKENVIIIKPKEQQESEKTKKVVKENIDIKNMAVGVSKLRKGGKGALILGCESEQELKQLKSTAVSKLGDKYQIIEPRGAQPKLKIFNLDEEEIKCDEGQIVDMIIKQNHLDEKKRGFYIKIVKKIDRRGQDGNTNTTRAKRENGMLIVEVDEITHVEMLKTEKINIGWRKCHVTNYVNVKRCYNCWGFYHIAKNCTRPVTCSKCAGNHKDSECKVEKEKCVNCMYKNKTYNLKINEEHGAMSRECPTLKKLLEEEKKKIRWKDDA